MDLELDGLEIAEPRILQHIEAGDLSYLVLLRQEGKAEVRLARLDMDELRKGMYMGLPPEWQVQGVVRWVRSRALTELGVRAEDELRLRLRLYKPRGARLLANLGLVARGQVRKSEPPGHGIQRVSIREAPGQHAGDQARVRTQAATQPQVTRRPQAAPERQVTRRPQAAPEPQATRSPQAAPEPQAHRAQAHAPTLPSASAQNFREQTEALDHAYRELVGWMLTSTEAMTKLVAEQQELTTTELAHSRAQVERLLEALERR